jgi:hypothetical protein
MMGITGKKIIWVFMPGKALGGRFYQNKGPCETIWLYLPFLSLCLTCVWNQLWPFAVRKSRYSSLLIAMSVECKPTWWLILSSASKNAIEVEDRFLYSCLPGTFGRLLPVLGGYPVWLVRTDCFEFQFVKPNENWAWFLDSELELDF